MYYVMLKADSQGNPEDHWAVHLHTDDLEDATRTYGSFIKSYGECGVRLVQVVEIEVNVTAVVKE